METIHFIDPHRELVAQCKKGDRKAQFELYKLYSKAMLNVSFRIVNHIAEAEDILQESFLQAFKSIEEFEGLSTFGLWLKQIVVNRSINQLRKRKLVLEELDAVQEQFSEEAGTDEELLSMQVKEIHQAIQQLPDGFRIVLSLYLLEGYDHEEIAQVLKISESTSRTQYMRAKKKLHILLAERRFVHVN